MAKKWSDLKAQMSPERQARIDTQTEALRLEMNLAELRKARDLTQSGQIGSVLKLSTQKPAKSFGSQSAIEGSVN